jgi:hypothetical protein
MELWLDIATAALFNIAPSIEARSITGRNWHCAARPPAGPILPRLNEAPFPNAPPFPIRFGLRVDVRALAVLRPIEREPVSDEPIGDVRTGNSANSHDALITAFVDIDAVTGRRAIMASRSFAAFCPQRYCVLVVAANSIERR